MKGLSNWLNASDKSSAFSAIRPTDNVDRFPKKDHPTIAQADAKTDLGLILKFLRLDTNKLALGVRIESAQKVLRLCLSLGYCCADNLQKGQSAPLNCGGGHWSPLAPRMFYSACSS